MKGVAPVQWFFRGSTVCPRLQSKAQPGKVSKRLSGRRQLPAIVVGDNGYNPGSSRFHVGLVAKAPTNAPSVIGKE